MSKIAFIFPGQGAQYVGMGKDFYDAMRRRPQRESLCHRIRDPATGICLEAAI